MFNLTDLPLVMIENYIEATLLVYIISFQITFSAKIIDFCFHWLQHA